MAKAKRGGREGGRVIHLRALARRPNCARMMTGEEGEGGHSNRKWVKELGLGSRARWAAATSCCDDVGGPRGR
jgi:hypothetical protein